MRSKTLYLVKGSIFLAFGLIVPQLFHLVGMAGPVFLPMHIPVLLCGFLLGPKMGLVIGAITPLLSSVLTGMPVLFPMGIIMMFELATYGLMSGYLYKIRKHNVFVSLLISMLIGRLMSGVLNFILLSISGKGFVLTVFLTASFVTSLFGIILQLFIIPILVKSFEMLSNKETVTDEITQSNV